MAYAFLFQIIISWWRVCFSWNDVISIKGWIFPPSFFQCEIKLLAQKVDFFLTPYLIFSRGVNNCGWHCISYWNSWKDLKRAVYRRAPLVEERMIFMKIHWASYALQTPIYCKCQNVHFSSICAVQIFSMYVIPLLVKTNPYRCSLKILTTVFKQ